MVDLVGIGFSTFLAGLLTTSANWMFSLVYGVSTWLWMLGLNLYNSRLVVARLEEFTRLAKAATRSLLTASILGVAIGAPADMDAAMGLYLVSLAVLGLEREVIRQWFARRRRHGIGLWHSVLVAAGDNASKLQTSIDDDPTTPHQITDCLDPADYGSTDELLTRCLASCRQADAHGVVLVESDIESGHINSLVRGLLAAGLYVDIASSLMDISADRLATRSLGPTIATWIAPRPRGGWRGKAKRSFDLAVASSAVIVLAPVLALLAVLVKTTSPGPVLFRQERVGRDGEPFRMLKFRSMSVDAEARLAELSDHNEGHGPLFKMKDDPRVTRVGRVLRKTSLDELPQLFNVIRNEMSLVGPRPALAEEMSDWESALYDRLQVRPGITGMWQVSGRSGTSFEEYTRLDLYYVHNWSLFVDVAILFKTIPAVLKSEGAY